MKKISVICDIVLQLLHISLFTLVNDVDQKQNTNWDNSLLLSIKVILVTTLYCTISTEMDI